MPIAIPEISRTTVLVDVKENVGFLPNCNCVPISPEEVANDRVVIETVQDRKGRALRFQFESEVGGPFGTKNPFERLLQETLKQPGADEKFRQAVIATYNAFDSIRPFSPYAIYLNEGGVVYLQETSSSPDGSAAADDKAATKKVDEMDRMLLILSSALACYGQRQKSLELVDFASGLYDQRGTFTTIGSDLPEPDRVANQKKTLVDVDRYPGWAPGFGMAGL